MSTPPFDGRLSPGSGQPPPPPGYAPVNQPVQWAQPPAQSRSGGGAGKWVAAGVAGVLALGLMGGGAVFAFSAFNGSGLQPETAVPASAIAFAKVDLDPSADQKVDAFRFARKFPGAQDPLAGMDENGDLRKAAFEGVQREGGLEGVDYEQDIEPWLGQRLGIAVLPPEEDAAPGAEPPVVVALASTDEDAARDGLAKATANEGYCSVQADFAICGEEQAVVDKAVNDAKAESLADDATFTQDMDDLGEDGLATGWVDASAMTDAIASTKMDGAPGGAPATDGRYAVALRFDGPTLELAGRINGLSEGSVPAGDGTSIGDLPADTLGALAITGLDESLTKAWTSIDDAMTEALGSSWQEGVDGFTAETGISLPDDISKAVGDDTVIAVGPDAQTPKVAVRSNGDRATIDKLVGVLGADAASDGMGLVTKDADDQRTVVATDTTYADEIASGTGLGDSEAFKDAVPDADKAGTVAYVDVTSSVEVFGDELSQEERENLEPLSAVGFAVWGEGGHADFRLRLTTS